MTTDGLHVVDPVRSNPVDLTAEMRRGSLLVLVVFAELLPDVTVGEVLFVLFQSIPPWDVLESFEDAHSVQWIW